ncbi:MAG: DNA-3-methyladenine glycosylase I [Litorilituus sp.]|jgi:3-methyladenine DNA glycosylase Tag|nr:DNA-3-methyladenine glycosylase I [Litorilituus sp.]
MEPFDKLYTRAVERKGGEQVLSNLISKPLNAEQLCKITNDRVLSEVTKKIFQSGFVWSVVEKKWDSFEEVFWGFNIEKLVMMPDDMLERKATDPAIIRNYNKVKTIRENALMLKEISDEYGSVGKWLAQWSTENIIGLWAHLKKHGSRLGGNTGPYALRKLGKDTFILSKDVETYFRANQLINGGLTSKRSLNVIQQTFSLWQKESRLSLQEISQIVAYSTGSNHV